MSALCGAPPDLSQMMNTNPKCTCQNKRGRYLCRLAHWQIELQRGDYKGAYSPASIENSIRDLTPKCRVNRP